jgi:hypothetical protein
MDLRNIGEARADEHLAAGGMPVEDRGGAKLSIAIRLLRYGRRDRWDSLHDEVVAGLYNGVCIRGRRRLRSAECREQKGEKKSLHKNSSAAGEAKD